MKTTLSLSIALFVAGSLAAQTATTVSTTPGNAEQVWYSLQNGVVANAPLDEWDLAFEMAGFTASIRVNTAKGITVYETNAAIADWDAVNSVDTANWTPVWNADSSWSVAALSHGNDLADPDGVNVGWGIYNMVTHVIQGSKIYALQMPDASWKKLKINSLAAGTYNFTYADLDGANAHTEDLVKANFSGKNFGYFSFATNSTLDREPLTTDWDLLFTKYTGFVPTPYGVAGVLQNKDVTALQVDGVPTADAEWTSAPLSDASNIIGSDWKSYDFNQGAYTVVGDRTYFVKDVAGNIWKLVFTAYGGSATGDMSFNQEMVSATGVAEQAAHTGTLIVAPNPVIDGQARLVVDVPGKEGVLSVYNAAGQVVLQQSFSGLDGLGSRNLDVSGLQKGMYVMRLNGTGFNAVGKLVIE
jgi:hypothetical protein